MSASLPRGLVLSALALASVASADSTVPPPGLRDVGIEQRLDQALPLDLVFRDESDNPVKLGDFFGQKPVLLSFVYYHCPMLCPMALEGLVRSLRPLSWNVGEEFDIVTVSIDEHETAAQAAEKKRKIVASYGRDRAAGGWHFLVGEGDAGRRLAEAVGFRFRYDGATNQFAHATGLFVLDAARPDLSGSVRHRLCAARRSPGPGRSFTAEDRHARRSVAAVLLPLRSGDREVRTRRHGGRADRRRADARQPRGVHRRAASARERAAQGVSRRPDGQAAVLLFPDQASSVASSVDLFFFFMVAVSGFFSVLIATLILFFAIRYREGGPRRRSFAPRRSRDRTGTAGERSCSRWSGP